MSTFSLVLLITGSYLPRVISSLSKYQTSKCEVKQSCREGDASSLTMLSTTTETAVYRPISKVECKIKRPFKVTAEKFPTFLPSDVEKIKDKFALKLAAIIERLPVQNSLSFSCIWVMTRSNNFSSEQCKVREETIMSSCVTPVMRRETSPMVLLHGFDSSCLEWRYTYPLLEEAGLETWAFDILGWGFSDLEKLPPCDVATKREHFYKFWKSHIKRPVVLVGPSLGAAVATDIAVNHPEMVESLILMDASVYAEGTGNLATLPKAAAYAGVSFHQLKPLIVLEDDSPMVSHWKLVGTGQRLVVHCLYPWWEGATMTSGGYSVTSLIKKKTLIPSGEDDQIISNKLAWRLHGELSNASVEQISNCGHLPHVEKLAAVAKLIAEFVKETCQCKEVKIVS